MSRVIIFGNGDYAQQAHYYLTRDSEHEISAFCVSKSYCNSKSFLGLPLVEFETVEEFWPPSEYSFFLPLSGRSINRVREAFYLAAKGKGYTLISYVSSRAIICDNEIGENCFILESVNIQPFARIGNNTTIWCNTHIGHHSVVEDHVSVVSGAVVSGRCTIGANSYIAANAVINDNVTLAQGTLVGINAVVKSNTEAWGIYTGDPARRRKISSKDFEFL
jgi:sugar O-acyltransferase (sialic acid O-acetyltransferase NeuD family)